MRKFFALVLIAALMALAIPTTADAAREGTRTRECHSDEYGRWCQTVWTSDDGVIQRGHWTWESRDGSNSSRGWWRTNYKKGISFGQSFYEWFYSFFGGKG